MTERAYKVMINGNGLAVDREIDEDMARQLIGLLMRGRVSAPAGLESDDSDARRSSDPDQSIREFLDAREAKKATEKITAVGAFLSRRGQESFTSADVRRLLEEARETLPKNLPRDMGKTVTAGMIAPRPGDRSNFYVTATGARAVEANFST